MYRKLILNEFSQSICVLQDFINNENNLQNIECAAKLIVKALKSGGKVISCGNGGSQCDAMHFSEELMGRYRVHRVGYAAVVVSDPSYLTCVSNDFGYEFVFSRYIESLGNSNDVLVCFSTSGNSRNVLYAIKAAEVKNMTVVSLIGNTQSKIAGLSDVDICVPHVGYSDRIQEIHIKIIHILILLIEKEMSM
ncbi:MAG: D-sedoheptulose 7-phosphate isomerase [Candidatus Westeberhardia cardiocondylae]|nr:D-sedoheptulose 7-phosphate isomerase [Candidatus Westeberhardia cardiocondylae]